MNFESNLADNHWFYESIFSGNERGEDKDIEKLVEDYSRVGKRKGTEYTKNLHDDQSSQVEHSQLENINDLVVPLSKRRSKSMHLASRRSLTPLAEWEGYVASIEGEEFRLRLVNIASGDELADEEASFSINELSMEQRSRLEIGTIVRWVIGLERLSNDRRRKVSELHFRMLPAYTERDLERAFQQAGNLIDEISWDETSKSG